ncbi:MAG: hypothetical protein Q8Q02_15505 [Nocardioides sp.]|nr:hypothetical protein [Nocardioides sp.]
MNDVPQQIREQLHPYLASARWFGGKGREFEVVDVTRMALLPGEPALAVDVVTVRFPGRNPGDPSTEEQYQLPLTLVPEADPGLDHAFVGWWEDPDQGWVHAYDAVHDRAACTRYLQAFADEAHHDRLTFVRMPGHELDLDATPAPFTGEQSNSSVAFGEDSLMKLFRKISPGRNPDIDIHAELTRAGSEHVAELYGWIEATSTRTGEPVHLAMLQEFLRAATDGWDLARASVRDLCAEADLHADEVGGDFAGETARLGAALAEVHASLAERFPVETWGSAELTGLADAMDRRLDDAVAAVPYLGGQADALRAVFARVRDLSSPVRVHRVHGDLHLGQTLRSVLGWKVVDFEGEPAKPLAERVLPDSPWRDIAGMLRSFDYAAHAVVADLAPATEEARQQLEYRAQEWSERNRGTFVGAYAEAIGVSVPLPEDAQVLLAAYVADKAVYETVYEARNRPAWVGIPLSAIERIAAQEAPS